MAFNIVEANVCGLRSYSFIGDKGDEVQMTSVAFQYKDSRFDGNAVGTLNMSEKKSIGEGIRCGSLIKVVFYDRKWHFVEAC